MLSMLLKVLLCDSELLSSTSYVSDMKLYPLGAFDFLVTPKGNELIKGPNYFGF